VKIVDELGKPGVGETGQIQFAREQVQQGGLADVGPADEGEFRQGLVGTRIQISGALSIKNGG